jgi:hypothetical protein
MSTVVYLGSVATGAMATLALLALVWVVLRRISVLSEGVMGRPAVEDRSGAVVEKAVPSLQARVGKIEELLVGQADANKRLTELEAWKVQHEDFSQNVVLRLLDMQSEGDSKGTRSAS